MSCVVALTPSLSPSAPVLRATAVLNIVSNAESHVEEGLGDTDLEPGLYASVALELLRTPGNAVLVSDLHSKFGKAAAALLAADYVAFQDTAPLGASVPDPFATVKLYRPVCAAEVLIWRRMEQRLVKSSEKPTK